MQDRRGFILATFVVLVMPVIPVILLVYLSKAKIVIPIDSMILLIVIVCFSTMWILVNNTTITRATLLH